MPFVGSTENILGYVEFNDSSSCGGGEHWQIVEPGRIGSGETFTYAFDTTFLPDGALDCVPAQGFTNGRVLGPLPIGGFDLGVAEGETEGEADDVPFVSFATNKGGMRGRLPLAGSSPFALLANDAFPGGSPVLVDWTTGSARVSPDSTADLIFFDYAEKGFILRTSLYVQKTYPV